MLLYALDLPNLNIIISCTDNICYWRSGSAFHRSYMKKIFFSRSTTHGFEKHSPQRIFLKKQYLIPGLQLSPCQMSLKSIYQFIRKSVSNKQTSTFITLILIAKKYDGGIVSVGFVCFLTDSPKRNIQFGCISFVFITSELSGLRNDLKILFCLTKYAFSVVPYKFC